MGKPASVRVTVYVAVDPETAFKAFTEEIDAWYVRGPHTLPPRTVGVRFETHLGGRLLAVRDGDADEDDEMGRVTVWEPGRRLVFVDRRDTIVEITFESVGDETKVVLEHRGLERLRPALSEHTARFGWGLIMPWFDDYMTKEGSTT